MPDREVRLRAQRFSRAISFSRYDYTRTRIERTRGAAGRVRSCHRPVRTVYGNSCQYTVYGYLFLFSFLCVPLILKHSSFHVHTRARTHTTHPQRNNKYTPRYPDRRVHKSVCFSRDLWKRAIPFAALKGGKGGMAQLNHASWIPDRFGRADARSSPPPPRAVALAVLPPIRSHRRIRLSPSLGRV